MSVENFDQLGGAIEFLGEDTPQDCFYCGKPLAGLTVLWRGVGALVATHPGCGLDLGARLIRDALNAKYLGDGGSPMAGIAQELRFAKP